ncbi:MAG: general secretion pathway protein GspK [Thermodesulfobacteriota bacterium]
MNSRIRLCNPQSLPIRQTGAIRSRRGVALIMVLWVITILSVIALEFCFAMRTEVNITKNFKEEVQLYAIAEGGFYRAIAELIFKHDPRIQQMRKGLKVEEIPPEKKEWVTDGRLYSLPSDQGVNEIRIMGEAGKVNINTVSEKTLRSILTQLGLEGETKDIVADSILDWRDADDFTHLNGAENDYYQSLKEPYRCKNANLDSIEELLLVRGVTPELFYGRKPIKKEEEGQPVDRIGLKDIFSIYSIGEQIDMNCATLPVLRVVLGIPKEIAQRVVKAREEKTFESQPDLLQRVPELTSFMAEKATLMTYQSTVPYYTIESRGKSKDQTSRRGLKVIVRIDPADKKGYRVIQWVDVLI